MKRSDSLISKRGSALILVLIVGAALSVVIASTLPMLITEFRSSHRDSRRIAAHHLAEGAVDLALSDIMRTPTEVGLEALGWTRNDDTGLYRKEFGSAEIGWAYAENIIGRVQVLFEDPILSDEVRVWAKANVDENGQNAVEGEQYLQVRVRVNPGTISNPFVGISGSQTIKARNNAVFDSYDSDIFPYTYANGLNNSANIMITATTTDVSEVELNSSEVYGNVAVGTESETPTLPGSPTVSGSVTGNYQFPHYPVIVPDVSTAETSLYAP